MTGFGEGSAASEQLSVSVSIRSVNHRALDLKLKLPQHALSLEAAMRKKLRERLLRGSIQVAVTLEILAEKGWRVDRQLLAARLEALDEIAAHCGRRAQPDPNHLIGLPGTLERAAEEVPAGELQGLVEAALHQALQQLEHARAEEGREIAAAIDRHAIAIGEELEVLTNAAGSMPERAESRLRERLRELLNANDLDPARLAQEVALLASKSDVSEELQRLRAHRESLCRCLREDREVGKRIDFIAQEMNREANTLLSKVQIAGAGSLAVTEAGLRMRGEIEKIREQTLNLE